MIPRRVNGSRSSTFDRRDAAHGRDQQTAIKTKISNAMTVDVEDYLHISAFERHIHREDWDRLPCRVERNTDRILDLFAGRRGRAAGGGRGGGAGRGPARV